MEALCRITLTKPYRDKKDFVIPLGDGQVSLIPMGGGQFNVGDPNMHVGFNKGQAEQLDALGIGHEQNQFNAAQDVVYNLAYGKDGSIIVPVSCATRWFGDFTVKPGDTRFAKVKRTYAQEKVRVAMAWGDYLRMPRGRREQDGQVRADTRIIGAPDVPHVKIEMLEQNGQAVGEAFDPWEFYKWDLDIDANAVREAKIIADSLGFTAPRQIDARPQLTAEDFFATLDPTERTRLAQMLAQALKNGEGKDS